MHLYSTSAISLTTQKPWAKPGGTKSWRKLSSESEMAEVEYKCTDFYDKADEVGLLWSSVGIAWPVREPLLSAKDAALPRLDQLREELEA